MGRKHPRAPAQQARVVKPAPERTNGIQAAAIQQEGSGRHARLALYVFECDYTTGRLGPGGQCYPETSDNASMWPEHQRAAAAPPQPPCPKRSACAARRGARGGARVGERPCPDALAGGRHLATRERANPAWQRDNRPTAVPQPAPQRTACIHNFGPRLWQERLGRGGAQGARQGSQQTRYCASVSTSGSGRKSRCPLWPCACPALVGCPLIVRPLAVRSWRPEDVLAACASRKACAASAMRVWACAAWAAAGTAPARTHAQALLDRRQRPGCMRQRNTQPGGGTRAARFPRHPAA